MIFRRKPVIKISRKWLVPVLVSTAVLFSIGQYRKSELAPPPPSAPATLPDTQIPDSVFLPSPVRSTLPPAYTSLMDREYAADLSTPSNIRTEVEYDPASGLYYVHTRLGEKDLVTPYAMSAEEYNKVAAREEMRNYFRLRNTESVVEKQKNPFDILDMNFNIGPLEKIFGPGGVRLTTQGSLQMSMGIKSNKTDNPALSL
ncbi:MAG: hypothetical protein K2G90_06850, partial [Muribaculaceae bacterium]|nr:hypothetical protein [Muribaculaceae bacterium]